jgi:flagellar biosynthesis GTPase FlhF
MKNKLYDPLAALDLGKNEDSYERKLKKQDNREMWGDVLKVFSSSLGEGVKAGASKGSLGKGGLALAGLSGGLNALGNIFDYKNKQSRERMEKKEAAEGQARMAEQQAIKEEQNRIVKDERQRQKEAENRKYLEDQLQKRYEQSRADEDRRNARKEAERKQEREAALRDQAAQREAALRDQSVLYDQRRFMKERDKVLPKLSSQDQQDTYKYPGIEKLAVQPSRFYNKGVFAKIFGQGNMTIPKQLKAEYMDYVNKVRDSEEGKKYTDEQMFNAFMRRRGS